MGKKQLLSGSFAALGMLILILDGKTALIGAQNGIDLCLKTVIPALFPFFILSILLTNALSGTSFSMLSPIRKLCGIPLGAESILISGFLGGYPVGAQAIGTAYSAKQLSYIDAARMLSFCSNAGPAFLFGMISGLFQDKSAPFLLWFIHIGSALLIAGLQPKVPHSLSKPEKHNNLSLPQALQKSIVTMATICGWVVLFRIILAFLSRWILWIFPTPVQVILTGFLELTNGCCELSRISNPDLRFVVCSGMLAWGGLCVVMQTQSVICGLPLRHYLQGKVLQCILSLLLSTSVVLDIWFPVSIFLLLLTGIFQKGRKRSGNPAAVGV